MKKYYLYRHTNQEGQIFYIGKGTYNNTSDIRGTVRAYAKYNRSVEWKNLAKDGYKVDIIYESDDEDEILERENELMLDCQFCCNKQVNTFFGDYEVVKITDEIALLNIYKKTYIIKEEGIILNSSGNILVGNDNGKKYLSIYFSRGEKIKKRLYIHRLVAEAFIPNPLKLKVVNHIDLDKTNNKKSNLEWTTQKENVQHSVKLGSYTWKEKIKQVYQFSINGDFIKEWYRASEVSNFFGCVEELIQQACSQKNSKPLSAKGYLWIYKKDYENNIRTKFNMAIEKFKIRKNYYKEPKKIIDEIKEELL